MARSAIRGRHSRTVAVVAGLGVTPTPTPVISGTLADGTQNQPYDRALIVAPPGTPVSVNGSAYGQPHSVGKGITHDGFGRFTSTGATL